MGGTVFSFLPDLKKAELLEERYHGSFFSG
jgi:hypothetical protein